MAIKILKTNYSGDVLEQLLTRAVTSNELVERGLIRIEPGVNKAFHLPRLRTGRMLQKRKEMPQDADSKGDFQYDEVTITPRDFMVYTTFNPRSFEQVWRKFQPTGELVFRELPPEVQSTLLSEVAKTVSFELGDHLINGVYGDGEGQFFNGILTNILSNNSVKTITSTGQTMIDRLFDVFKAIPKTLRSSKNLRILMSRNDADTYDNELSALHHKGTSVQDLNASRYKSIKIEPLTQWPDGVIVATICGMDADTNLWAACNLQEDANVIQVDKVTNAGERYFIKMLMTMDTAIAFGEDVVLLDFRGAPDVKFITAMPNEIVIPATGGQATAIVTASGKYDILGAHVGFEATKVEGGILIKAEANTTESDRMGTIELQLKGSSEKAVIEVFQANGK